jgi:uncharacterized protein
MAAKVLDFIKGDSSSLTEIYVHFFGGEPLIKYSTVDFLAGTLRSWAEQTHIKLRLGLTTNGTLLTPKVCEGLKGHAIGVQLSRMARPRVMMFTGS